MRNLTRWRDTQSTNRGRSATEKKGVILQGHCNGAKMDTAPYSSKYIKENYQAFVEIHVHYFLFLFDQLNAKLKTFQVKFLGKNLLL